LNDLVADGSVRCVEVEGMTDMFYFRSKDAHLFDANDSPATKTIRFIAPLDNMIWDRDMLASLFGFAYTWEVYVPPVKRKYGYYVIPVLYGNRFIARFEPQKSDTHMQIKNWWWEEGVAASNDLIDQIVLEAGRFADCFDKTEGVHESVISILRGKTR
jgi:uncharacterized protein YcaQ